MPVTATHNENADWRLTVHTVIDPLQPPVEPTQMEGGKIQRRFGTELRLAGMGQGLTSVSPGPHNQPDGSFLGLAERNVVQVGSLQIPGVVPAAHKVDGNVL